MSGPIPVGPAPQGAKDRAAYAGGLSTTVTRAANNDARRSRRRFIRELGAATAWGALLSPAGMGAALAAGRGAKGTLVGSNVYGWTQYAQRDKKEFQVGDVLSALRDTGYDYLEYYLDVAAPEKNAEFADQCKSKGLQPVSLYVGARLHEAGKTREVIQKIITAAEVCRQSGFRVISCNAEPIGREKTEEELQTQAAAMEELGAGLKALGLSLGIHQHLPEMASQGREFHYVFDHTKPGVVGWCYDVHWVWKGGVQPLDALKQYGKRVVTWHLRQSRSGIWWEDLDTGDVDYSAVAAYAGQHKLQRRFSVELALEEGTKVTRSVVENHRRSREFVRRVFEQTA